MPQLFTQAPATIQSNIETVVRRFAADGLTTWRLPPRCARRPILFTMAPATVAGKVEGVAKHFAAHGLTLSDYLAAAVKQPALFYLKPDAIQPISSRGLAFQRRATNRQGLLRADCGVRSSSTEACHHHCQHRNRGRSLPAHGLSCEQYLRASVKQPQLFCRPRYHHRQRRTRCLSLRRGRLSLSEYVAAAVRQPSLFYQSPATIQANIEA